MPQRYDVQSEEEAMKTCTKCKQTKPLTSFYPKRGKHQAQCNECEKERKRRAHSPIANAFCIDARRDDLKRGHKTDIDIEFFCEAIKKSKKCSYCGCPDRTELSLDRIDNSKGHLKTNVVVACLRCNRTRGNRDYAEWLANGVPVQKARRKAMTAKEWKLRQPKKV